MKKLFVLLVFALMLCLSNTAKSQDYHRLANGEPYDIFYIAKPAFFSAYGDYFPVNYDKGAGINFALEYQFQEIKVGVGVELGYTFMKSNSYKIKYLPRKFLNDASQIPLTIYVNYYLHNQESYFSFGDRLKPYVGIGFGAIWGKYDYSLSTDANKDYDAFGYYLREYEGQAGIRVGILPRIGLLISGERHAFGFEAGYQHYFSLGRLEQQQHFSVGLTYCYIIQ
ncbi:hypothetical protein SDC9_25486 [bioreactor metagenome]|uniref:Outer membrane protein beta-barrel domain-containing protein n=1 Tax=bioreactor metagenome TaxID=1076179 RepID=A0A644UL72_9ZZZZ|nr:outer membrane beta-barrel protein [Bacteroidales bacterium]MDD3667130.1 outer membrane beta-barrel protein [Bacteroidales bacterium]